MFITKDENQDTESKQSWRDEYLNMKALINLESKRRISGELN